MEYRREIDGLRAVAVVPVIFFHAGFDLFSGGYVGVDVFFVISGYLITSIILSEKAAGSFSLIGFYDRRARRILPALFVVMGVCFPFAWFLLLPGDMREFSESLAAVALFSSNILFWLQSGYFDTAAELKPLLHTWSLAVEEQYYVLFPLFLMLTWRLCKRALPLLIGIIALLSFMLADWGAYHYPAANFFLLPSRAWELAVGAMTAIYFGGKHREVGTPSLRQGLSLIGLIAIAYAVVVFDENTPFPSLYALIPILGTAAIIVFATNSTMVGRLLAHQALVGIGLVSYSAYLWHQPLFVFARHASFGEVSILTYAVLALASLGLAWLTWRFVERPFRRRGLMGRKMIFSLAGLGSLCFLLLGVYGAQTGFEGRFQRISERFPGYELDNQRLHEQSWQLLRELSGSKSYGVGGNRFDQELWYSDDPATEKVLIIGNSHSKDFFNLLQLNQERFPNYEFARYGLRVSCLGADKGAPLFSSPNYKAANRIIVSTLWRLSPTCDERTDLDGLMALIKKAEKDGKELMIASNTLAFPGSRSKTLADDVVLKHWWRNRTRQELINLVNREYYKKKDATHRVEVVNNRLRAIARRHEVTFLDKEELLCNAQSRRCLGLTDDFAKAFYDSHHYTLAGALQFGRIAHEKGWLR